MVQTIVKSNNSFVQIYTPVDSERIINIIKRQIGDYLLEDKKINEEDRNYLERVLDLINEDTLNEVINGWRLETIEDKIIMHPTNKLVLVLPADTFAFEERLMYKV